MDIASKATIEAKISWDTSDGGYGGLLLGGIGFIDKSGYLHDFVGINDGDGVREKYGLLGAVTRDYQVQSNYGGETWKKFTEMTGATGSAELKLVKEGKHVKLFIGDSLVTEHDTQGEIAGIVMANTGHLYFPFGTLRVEKLELK